MLSFEDRIATTRQPEPLSKRVDRRDPRRVTRRPILLSARAKIGCNARILCSHGAWGGVGGSNTERNAIGRTTRGHPSHAGDLCHDGSRQRHLV